MALKNKNIRKIKRLENKYNLLIARMYLFIASK